jgi:hypothetical protein
VLVWKFLPARATTASLTASPSARSDAYPIVPTPQPAAPGIAAEPPAAAVPVAGN